MLDRRDFDEWWSRECKRQGGRDLGTDAKHWAEAGFMAAQLLIRAQVRSTKTPARLLQGGRHG